MSYVKDPIYGNHLGIVVNDASFDPEQRGRVQVWIPYLTNTLHAGWNDRLEDKEFKHVHESGALTPELVEELKNVLPWAECAGPIMGGGTSATYNPTTGITDTNPQRTFNDGALPQLGSGVNIPPDAGDNPDLSSLNPVFVNRLNAFYDELKKEGYDVRITSGSRERSNPKWSLGSAHNAEIPGGAIAADLKIVGNGKYGNVNISTLGNPSLDGKNSDTPEFRKLAEEFGLYQPLHPVYNGSIPEKWHFEPIETRNGRGFANNVKTSSSLLNSTDEYSQQLKKPVDTAEIAGETKNAAARADSSDHSVGNLISKNVSQEEKKLSKAVPTTGYSIGKSYGGTDETEDVGTGRGLGSFNNELRPGVVAVNTSVYPIGTIFKNTDTGNVYIAADKHGNANPNVVDIYYTPSQYNQLKQKGALNIPTNLAVIGSVNQKDIPTTSEGLKNFLSQYGNVPEGEGAFEFLANIKDGNFINSPTLNPIPNNNPPVFPASLAGTSPSGFISTPKIGAKVFVFFLGGDIQKPVYFAGLLEKESYQKAQAVASPQKSGFGTDVFHESNYFGLAGGMLESNQKATIFNGVRTENDAVSLYSRQGSGFDLSGANTTINATNDFQINASGTSHFQSLESSRNIKGRDNTVADQVEIKVGFTEKQNKEIYESQKKLNDILKEIQNEKIQEIEKTAKSGEKIPCPLCSTSYAVDRASGFSKRVFNLLRKIKLPYFSYVIDVFQFLTTVILIPFCSIVPGRVLGKCGNSECKDGMIPSPQKPIENANKKAAQKLVSKQKEISELEKKLGSGGCYSVVATKDVVISAGLVMNDADCYAKTVNKSNACKGQIGDKSNATIIKGSCDNLKNTPFCSPNQYPGGNLLLKGGNAVKIIAGSPGIELNTKGKITLNCGSLEVIGTDGELVLGSKNHTILKGHTVTIDANNRTNDGGVEINAPHMICQGFTATGDIGIKGGARIEGELSIPYLNTVSQRMQADDGMSPDQRIPFATWAIGSAQSNDIANTTRLALTHYIMPGSLLCLSNIIKFVMQIMNTILTNVILEPTMTGIYYGFCLNAAGPGISWGFVQNFAHNHFEDPKPHHHDYIMPKGTYYDDIAGVNNSAVAPNPVPTRARKHGMGPEGGPKSLAGCGGFGGWGGGSGGRRGKYNKLNSFGLSTNIEPFTGTRLENNNLRFKYNPDGTIDADLEQTPCP